MSFHTILEVNYHLYKKECSNREKKSGIKIMNQIRLVDICELWIIEISIKKFIVRIKINIYFNKILK